MNETKISANQVNEKSLQLLMQVAVNPEPVSAKGLSEQLQVPLSSLYRHLKLLKEWNLIEESPHDKTLIIGPAALLLMRSYETSQHNLDAVEAVLSRLQKQTGKWPRIWCLSVIEPYALAKEKVCRRFDAASSRVKVNHCFEVPHLK